MRSSVLAAAVLSGCAYHSGIHPVGPDTYPLTVEASPMRGGQAGAKNIAMRDANEMCAKDGKEILVTNQGVRTGGIIAANGSSTVTFRCLAKGDPDLRRPDFESVTR